MKVYFLSGLGADARAFKNIQLPPEYEVVHINWLKPGKKESIAAYALRLAASINSKEPFVLIGLSFGGLVAGEITKIIRPKKTILISSIAKRNELPFYFRMAGYFRLNNFAAPFTPRRPNKIVNWFFGVSANDDKALFKTILKDSDPQFSSWAVNRLLNWKCQQVPENIVRIHGSNDRLLPIYNFKPDYLIDNGGHLMILNKAEEISRIITSELNAIKL